MQGITAGRSTVLGLLAVLSPGRVVLNKALHPSKCLLASKRDNNSNCSDPYIREEQIGSWIHTLSTLWQAFKECRFANSMSLHTCLSLTRELYQRRTDWCPRPPSTHQSVAYSVIHPLAPWLTSQGPNADLGPEQWISRSLFGGQ